ncbi:MAG TPA: hypothetical protein PLW03_08390 [Methylotenera sp.]|nr:hypothetical protein [Methylotenera sp.]
MSKSFTILMAVLSFMPLILGVLATLLAARIVPRWILFFLTSTLSMAGLQVIIASFSLALLPRANLHDAGGIEESLTRNLLISATILLIIGIPFLWWLASSLRNPNPSIKRDALKHAPCVKR